MLIDEQAWSTPELFIKHKIRLRFKLLFIFHCMLFQGRWGREWGSQSCVPPCSWGHSRMMHVRCSLDPAALCPCHCIGQMLFWWAREASGQSRGTAAQRSTLIRCGFQEFPTIASQEKKHGKSQKHETHNRSTSVISSPQMKVCFQQFFPFLFFLLASQTEDSFKSLLT